MTMRVWNQVDCCLRRREVAGNQWRASLHVLTILSFFNFFLFLNSLDPRKNGCTKSSDDFWLTLFSCSLLWWCPRDVKFSEKNVEFQALHKRGKEQQTQEWKKKSVQIFGASFIPLSLFLSQFLKLTKYPPFFHPFNLVLSLCFSRLQHLILLIEPWPRIKQRTEWGCCLKVSSFYARMNAMLWSLSCYSLLLSIFSSSKPCITNYSWDSEANIENVSENKEQVEKRKALERIGEIC